MFSKLIPITVSILTTSFWALPSLANILITGECSNNPSASDFCVKYQFISKNLIDESDGEKLYQIEYMPGVHYQNSNRPIVWYDIETDWVLCSTERPTYAYYDSSTSQYVATEFDPGDDYLEYTAMNGMASLYWVTCHNFVGPDFFSEEMTRRARALGYQTRDALFHRIYFTELIGILYGPD